MPANLRNAQDAAALATARTALATALAGLDAAAKQVEDAWIEDALIGVTTAIEEGVANLNQVVAMIEDDEAEDRAAEHARWFPRYAAA
jgi:hypothetical protein